MKKVVNPVSMLVLVSVMLVGLVGCGQKEVVETPPVEAPVVEAPVDVVEVEVSMEEVVNTIKYALGEQYLPSMQLDQETFNQLTGLTPDMYEEFYAEVPMMSAHVDKLFIVKTSDESAARVAAAKFEEYHAIQLEDAHQYPMNLAKVENAKVSVYDEYAFYYILGGYPVEEVVEEVLDTEATEVVVEDAVVEDAVVEDTVAEEVVVDEVGTEPNPNSAVEAPAEEAPVEEAPVAEIAEDVVVEDAVEEVVDAEVVSAEVDPEYEKLAAWAIASNEKVETALKTLFEVGYDENITEYVEGMFGPTVIGVPTSDENLDGNDVVETEVTEEVVVEEVEGEPFVEENADAEIVEPVEEVEAPAEGTVSDFE